MSFFSMYFFDKFMYFFYISSVLQFFSGKHYRGYRRKQNDNIIFLQYSGYIPVIFYFFSYFMQRFYLCCILYTFYFNQK